MFFSDCQSTSSTWPSVKNSRKACSQHSVYTECSGVLRSSRLEAVCRSLHLHKHSDPPGQCRLPMKYSHASPSALRSLLGLVDCPFLNMANAHCSCAGYYATCQVTKEATSLGRSECSMMETVLSARGRSTSSCESCVLWLIIFFSAVLVKTRTLTYFRRPASLEAPGFAKPTRLTNLLQPFERLG